jgi:hypothetical protein
MVIAQPMLRRLMWHRLRSLPETKQTEVCATFESKDLLLEYGSMLSSRRVRRINSPQMTLRCCHGDSVLAVHALTQC